MMISICKTCGHLMFGEAPEKCPVCGTPKKDFQQNDAIFKESQQKSPEAEVKHIPDVHVVKTCSLIPEEGCTDLHVRIGKTLHPMVENHYITFIDCYLDNKFLARVELTPNGIHPAGCFHLKKDTGTITIVEHCNIHGYWKTDITL